MRPDRRLRAGLGATLLALGTAFLLLSGGASGAGCTDDWTNTAGGVWNVAANWDHGVPVTGTTACIAAAGTYTVVATGSISIGALELGGGASGTQTLEVEGAAQESTLLLAGASTISSNGELWLDQTGSGGWGDVEASSGTPTLTNGGTILTTVEGTGEDYLEMDLDNTGTLDVRSGELAQDEATTTTNSGTIETEAAVSPGQAGSWDVTNASASVANSGSVVDNGAVALSGGASWTQSAGSLSGSNTVGIGYGGSLADSAGTGAFQLTGLVKLSGTIPSGQVVTVLGDGTESTAQVGANLTNDGTLVLDHEGSNGWAAIEATSGTPVLTNAGTITAKVGGTGGDDILEIDLDNKASGTLEVSGGELAQDHATATTNESGATIQVDSSASFDLTNASASLSNSGSVVDNGTVALTGGASWTQSGGSLSGSSTVGIGYGGSLSDSAGTGPLQLTGAVNLSGTIPSGQTVTVLGNSTESTAQVGANLTNDGTLVLDHEGSNGWAAIEATSGTPVLTNNGSILAKVGGTGGDDILEIDLDNKASGTLEVSGGELAQDHATATTNESGATIQVDSSGSFDLTNASASVVNSGSVVDNGTFALSGGASWTQSAGSLSGSSTVGIGYGGSLSDSAGTGPLQLTGAVNLSGTIPSGQTLTVLGEGVESTANVAGAVTNDGTLDVDNQGSGYADVAGAGQLTNDGTITTQGASAYLEVDLDNAAAGSVDASSGILTVDHATTTTNDGTFTVGSTAAVDISNGKFTNESDGRLDFQIDSASSFGTISVSGSTTFQLGGTGAGVLLGGFTPSTTGPGFTVLSGTYTGTFTSVTGGFAATYSPSSISLHYLPSQSITVTSPAPAGATVGGATYKPTATSSSGLTVAITLDASSTGCSLSAGGVVSFPHAGTCLIDFNQAGNGSYAAAPQRQQSIVIAKASQSITTTSTPPASVTVAGATYTPSATASSGLTVAITLDTSSTGCSLSGGGVVSFTAVGTCVIDFNQAGNGDYDAAPRIQQSIPVVLQAQTISPSTPPAGETVGAGATYTPTASATSGLTVAITLDASSTGCALSVGGVVSFPHTGTCVIDFNQAGNATYSAAPRVQQSIPIAAGSQTINPSTPPASATVGATTYTPTATSTSGLAVAITLDSSSSGCSLSSGVVSFTADGTCVIDFNQAGNGDYSAAPRKQQSIPVGPRAQSIAFTSTPPSDATVGGATYTPTATASSGLAVSITLDVSSTGCSLGLGVVSFTAIGTCVIDANQPGDAGYNAAPQSRQSIAVAPPPVLTPPPSEPAGSSQSSGPPPVTTTLEAPVLASTADVTPVSGTVLIRLPGATTFTPLTNATSIPLGSTIDATNGTVSLTVALPNGATETGQFYGGEFVLTQSPSGMLIATLAGGSYAGCPSAPKQGAALIAAAKKKKPTTVIRQLWGSAHGDYTTKGRYGSAAVSGTIWLTQDRCDGTYVRVTKDNVIVVAYAHPKTRHNVRQGHHILIPAPGY